MVGTQCKNKGQLGVKPAEAIGIGGDRQQHVTRLTKGTHLLRKNLFVAVIIGNGRDDGAVGGQRNRAQFWALALKTPHKLGRKMLRICG